VFKKGHRIRLEIASSAFPKYDRNPNTGAALGQSVELKSGDQTIYHDQEHPSHVVLPVVPPKP
jgi:putative CocE/NonD family hydrolase